MSKIKFAVIGAGHIGKRHAEMINRNPEAELVAIVDKLPAAQLNGNIYEVPLYNDINDLFKDNLILFVPELCLLILITVKESAVNAFVLSICFQSCE